jgi:hypothetical protein
VDSTTQAMAWAATGTNEQGWLDFAKAELARWKKEADTPPTPGWTKAEMIRHGLWRW